MGFDLEQFKAAKYTARTEDVKVPELQAFFGEDEAPVFIVRNLDGIEYGRVLDAVNQYKAADIRALIASVSTGETDSIVDGLKSYIDRAEKSIPDDIIKRAHLIRYGIQNPALDMDAVKKLRRISPEVFFRLSEKIKELTGMGAEPGE